MTVEADLRAAVIGDPTIAAIIGTRFYPMTAPDKPTFPLMVYHQISQVPYGSHDTDSSRVQIDAYAASPAVVKSLRNAVRALAQATGHYTFIIGFDDYEPEESLYRQTMDLIIVHEV